MLPAPQQSGSLNKKERRKANRAKIQKPKTSDNENDEAAATVEKLPTESTNEEVPDIVDIQETQRLTIETNDKVENHELAPLLVTEIASNGLVDEATTENGEKKDLTLNEEVISQSPDPTPPLARRRIKRIPIASAIPVLPPPKENTSPPPKPAPGVKGTTQKIYVNHFPAKVGHDIMLYQYDAIVEKPKMNSAVDWEEVLSRDQRRKFVQELATQNAFGFTYWYDEGKCFYSTNNINKRQFPLVYTLPHNDQYNLRFTIHGLAGQWSTSTIFDYLRSPISEAPSNAIRILETLLKQALLSFNHCEGSLFYKNVTQPDIKLNDGFELRLGFFQALCLTQTGLTLNLHTTLTKFYPYMTVLDFLEIHLRKDIRKNGMTSNDYEKAKIVLNGCKIATRQSNYTQIYQIRSFSDIPERQEFTTTKEININGEKHREPITYNLIQYFLKEKNIKIDYPKLRCLQCFFLHERKDPKHLPMEVCKILEWQECERESANDQRNRTSYSIPSPDQRYKDIMSSLRSCNYPEPPRLPLCKAVQLTVDDSEMKLINARVLPPPVINNNHAEIKMGRINLKGCFFEPNKIDSIAFVYFGPLPPRDSNQPSPKLSDPKRQLMETFVKAFDKMAKVYRVGPIQKCQRDIVWISENEQDREQNIEAIRKSFESKKQLNVQLVVCIMDSYWNELRPTIKMNGTVDFGIVTQCLLYSNLQEQIARFNRNPGRGSPDRILDNMCENLLRKINFKMQGKNTKVNLPLSTTKHNAASAVSKTEDAWQFMGADVIHPVCRQDKPSIAAVVGSGDSLCSTSAVRVCKQWPRDGKCSIEAVVDLKQMVCELLEFYRAGNDRLPNKIVFYRDGVDDGQFARVLNFEIPQLKEAFAEIYQNEPRPLLTFVVVKKRHHTRFFTLDAQNRTANVPVGLVVDTDVVHPGQFSFFLNSHRALQGTNRPALYHVLYDEIKFTADELQLLTFYLCFTDPRSSSSEAIPSVVHQADLAASNSRDLFREQDNSTNDGYAMDALENPSLSDIVTEHLRVHEKMQNTPHFG